jgi:enoyl-CoA hydratase
MSERRYVRFEQTERIGIVTLTGTNALTVLNTAILNELGSFFREVRSDAALRVLILTGEGKAFAAGADIKEMEGLSPGEAKEFSRLGNDVFSVIEEHPVPVIAAVNGFALGGGLELVLSADFAYASANARFALPEATLGLIPGFGGCRRLSARIGMQHAKELIFTGRVMKADEAARLGIVNGVTETDELLPVVMNVAREIAALSGNAVRAAKGLLTACSDRTAQEIQSMEIETFGSVCSHPDSRTGMSAFINKAKPVWREVP